MGTSGQLGNGGIVNKNSPTLTDTLGMTRVATSISSGYEHTCAILDNGDVSCWGKGSSGALGNGDTPTTTTVTTIVGSTTVNTATTSNPTETSPPEAIDLGTGRTAVALSSRNFHTCAILDNGAVSCWGQGNYRQLGNGGYSHKYSPTSTATLGTGRTAVALSSGDQHTCAILDNGAVSCWGSGANGQLGNGGQSTKSTPTLTSSLGSGRTAVALASGGVHTCAILDNGAVSCWGQGQNRPS